MDLTDAASQEAGRRVQSAHIARRRDVSGVANVRVALPHGEPRESHLARAVVVHCHMCVDMHDAASQVPAPQLQSAHIARRRNLSCVVRVRVALPHREPRESHLARAVVVHCHMCVNMCDSALQDPERRLQSAHIARRRDISGVVRVRVALPHREPREPHLVRAVVVHATCALTYLMLPRRYLYLNINQLTSLAGVTFPASLR
jgi:hypothetical protein